MKLGGTTTDDSRALETSSSEHEVKTLTGSRLAFITSAIPEHRFFYDARG
jgi:hypothetical protein